MKAGMACGFRYTVDSELGHLMVMHDGDISWDELMEVKDVVWGRSTSAIEVYPPRNMVVNSMNARHLWRLGEGDFWPDMLGRPPSDVSVEQSKDLLQARYIRAWRDSWNIFEQRVA